MLRIKRRKKEPPKPRFIKYSIDPKDLSDRSLCRSDIGKSTIDCCYQLSKSKWGFLGDQPAGLIYLSLIFQQPEGCRLDSAKITLTFQGDTDPNPAGANALYPSPEVRYFGPLNVEGPKKERNITANFQATPNLTFGGGGFGGVGGGKSTEITDSRWWKLRGYKSCILDGDEESDKYRQVSWELEENKFESQASHGDQFYAGVCFVHHEAVFNLEVEITGKLRRSFENLKYKTFKDPTRNNARIEPMRGVAVPHDSLESEAQRLQDKMEKLNHKPDVETQKTTTPATTNFPDDTSICADTTAEKTLVLALFNELAKLEERQSNRSIGHAIALAEDSERSKKEEDNRNINGSPGGMRWKDVSEKDVVNQYAEEQKGSANQASRDPFSQFHQALDTVKRYNGLILLAVFVMYHTVWHVCLGKS